MDHGPPLIWKYSYKVHRDYIDMDEETEEQEGNRIMTFYMYLNDVEEGGHTGFPDLGLKIAPKLGRVVMWPNVLNSEPDEASEMTNHEALPVIRGVKYGANLWFRQKPLATSYKRFTCDDDDYEDDEEGEKELDAIDDHASQVDNGDIEYREANTISNDEL
jgi:2OG-Fe(II) oxygenase superfamily